MVLDFGKGSLFRPTGLQQDTGLLKERWNQDGSVLVNATATITADTTLYTVTAGKRFFVNFLYVFNNHSTEVFSGTIKDGGASGTGKQYLEIRGYERWNPSLVTPMYFDTSFFFDFTFSGGDGIITISGWEEDAE